jgi:3-oxoacyl-[acyl-carrier protein] reductase
MTLPLGKETLDSLAEETPLGRNGKPEEIAQAALWISSPEASFLTGQVIGINGGLVI